MNCVQYAVHLDLSELNARILDVWCGPFRGVVRASCPQFPDGLSGRYTRVWLDNGYGVLVCEPFDENGNAGNRPLTLVPVQHTSGYDETMWTPAYRTGERVREGERVCTVAAVDVRAGVELLRDLSALAGHDMRAELRDAG